MEQTIIILGRNIDKLKKATNLIKNVNQKWKLIAIK